MLTLNDGRSELWQWDTGRTLAVDADCSQVHFSNKVFGRSIDVDVAGGVAIIPDILLQTDKDLNVWAFVGTADNGYTKISKTLKVNRRNKPADYVFTPTDQMTLQTIQSQIGDLADLTTGAKGTLVAAINEAARTGGGGGDSTVELDTTLTQSGKAADAKAVGDRLSALSEEIANLQTSGLTTAQVNALDGMFKVCAFIKDDVSAEYTEFKTAFGITDEPVIPEVTLSSISATYSGGDVAVGTAVSELTGVVVTAHYSDGKSETVTGYTMNGTIAEGNNTITVTYEGLTTTFTVTGVAESTSNIISVTWHGVTQTSYTTYEINESANMSMSEIIDVTGIDSIKVTTTSAKWTQCIMNTYASADSDYLTVDGTYGIEGSAGAYIQANSDSKADNSVFDVSNYNYVSIRIGTYNATMCRQYITVEKAV